MSNEPPFLSTLAEGETPEADGRARHAAAQRRYARSLRKRRAPSADDVARAVLGALRDIVRDPPATIAEQALVRRLVRVAVQRLLDRGYDGEEVRRRVLRTLDPTRPRSGR